MNANAERQAKYRATQKARGLKAILLYVPPELEREIRDIVFVLMDNSQEIHNDD